MKMTPKMRKALNEQINAELFSAYLYMAMSAWFETQTLSGFARWLAVQAKEEQSHAMKIYKHLTERGETVEFLAINKPPKTWTSPLAAFKDAYAHEQKITKMIEVLVDLAEKEKDHGAKGILQWFVEEQIEEEANASEIVEKMKVGGDKGAGLLMYDRAMGQRK